MSEKRSSSKRSSKSSSHKSSRKRSKEDHEVDNPISKDDYFTKSSEFQTWCKEERDVFFDDLTTERSHELFKKFVKRWNSGKLKDKYYQGISGHTTGRTSHTWSFDKTPGYSKASSDKKSKKSSRSSDSKSKSRREEKQSRSDREKGMNQFHKNIVADNYSAPSSRFEKKMQQQQIRRMDQRDRELSPDRGMGVRDITGAGDDSSKMFARRRQHFENTQAKKVRKANVLLEAHQKKEEEKLAMFREMAKNHKL